MWNARNADVPHYGSRQGALGTRTFPQAGCQRKSALDGKRDNDRTGLAHHNRNRPLVADVWLFSLFDLNSEPADPMWSRDTTGADEKFEGKWFLVFNRFSSPLMAGAYENRCWKRRRKAAVIGVTPCFSTFLSKFQQFCASRRLLPRALNLGINDLSRSVVFARV